MIEVRRRPPPRHDDHDQAALSVSNLVWRANKVVRSGNYRPWKRRTFSFWHCEAVDSDADGK